MIRLGSVDVVRHKTDRIRGRERQYEDHRGGGKEDGKGRFFRWFRHGAIIHHKKVFVKYQFCGTNAALLLAQPTMADGQQSPGLLANILAVAGFIILIVIIVWGAYHLLRLTGSGVSSLFSRFTQKDEISVTAPATAQSGKSFPLSWKYNPSENGTYAILYQCRTGFRIDATAPSGSMSQVPCGNAFTVGNNTSVTLTPTLSGTTTVEVPISVVFMATATSSEKRPQGSATIRVSASTSTPSGSNGNTTTTPSSGNSTATPAPAGPADLTVRILATGVIDAYGNFLARAPMNPNEVAAVKFDIGNSGGRSTGSWYFTVNLPTNPSFTYQSPIQASLAPGAHIENILRFRPVNPGGGNVYVSVDPQNVVSESNENNNAASTWFSAQVWSGYPYQAPYVY